MIKWYLYLDYGSGYVLITPYNLQMDLDFEVDEDINPFVKRKKTSGTFQLYGTEATTAKTFFITNGNDQAPFRIYENGISGVGTLKFQGFVNIKAEFDNRRTLITFDSFKTDDEYEPILSVINDESTSIESLGLASSFRTFYAQGQNSNCSKLQGYALSGSTWATTGNALSLGDVGRVAMDKLDKGVVVYDNNSKEIRRYTYTAPNWSLSTTGTSYVMPTLAGNGAICALSATQIAFIDDNYNDLYVMTATTGTYTVNSQTNIEDLKLPSLALLSTSSSYVALIDNGTKVLRAYSTSTGLNIGQTLSLGDLEKPCICTLDPGSNSRIALVDNKTNTLRAYTFDGTNFTEVGTNIKLTDGYEYQLTQDSTNVITVCDAIGGFIARYSFSGTAWTQLGSNTTISGGYMAACANEDPILGVIQSDCFSFYCSRTATYFDILNAVLSDKSLGLTVPSTGHGATFALSNIVIGEMEQLVEFSRSPNNENNTKVTLKQLFEIAEIFQNYWYIDGSNIKFTQPDLFSSTGTNFNISAVQRAGLYIKDENDQETHSEGFNIAKEKIEFKNAINAEHIGLPIDYNRDNQNEIIYPYNYTTDFNYIVDNFTGVSSGLSKSGLFLAYIELDSTFGYGIISANGVINSIDTRNNYMSVSQIMESFWKDYRLSYNRNFDLNGTSTAPQDTVKDIVRYTTLNLDYSDLGITEFPSSVGSLTWDTGKDGYIYRFSVSLQNNSVTIETGKLDI